MPSIIGIIPYAGIDLAVYSMLKEKYQQKFPGDHPSSVLLLCTLSIVVSSDFIACGALSSSMGAFVAYPFVTVRTRLQAQGMKGFNSLGYFLVLGRPVVYNGVSDCVQKIYKAENVFGFYRYFPFRFGAY